MNCVIIDDEKMARMSIRKLCAKVEFLNVVEEFDNAIDAIAYLDENPVDLIFLDIQLPELSGMDLIKSFQRLPQIVITTSHKNFAIDAFEHDVTDYLLKPIRLPRFLKAISKVRARAQKGAGVAQDEEIFIKVDSRLVKVSLNEVLWIEAKGDYALFKTESKGYTIHTTLKKLEAKLPPTRFIKVHRSFIVNLGKIIDIQDSTLVIGDKVIPISRSKKDALMGKLNLI